MMVKNLNIILFKSLSQLVAEFDPNLLKGLFGEPSFFLLMRFLGPNFGPWLDMFNRLFKVVQLLPQLSDRNLGSNALSDCMTLLISFSSMPPKWSVHSFVLIVEQVDPKIARMIFEMIEKILTHPSLTSYLRFMRNLQHKHDQPPPLDGAIQKFESYTLYDSLPKMIIYWRRLHAVPPLIFSNPAFARKFPVCSFQVARTDVRATLKIRQMMLCISSHYQLIISHIFSIRRKPRISRKMEQMLREYFGNKIYQRLLQ